MSYDDVRYDGAKNTTEPFHFVENWAFVPDWKDLCVLLVDRVQGAFLLTVESLLSF